ncbi:MAG TPA: YdcF family protein [Candidatus Acidoferrales bacterium]|jgi:uncharacterized SAM-binding protein YcdF (DUF218 family)|nr:YdcF family protein [Candidatus Acidoferrales bacterium]
MANIEKSPTAQKRNLRVVSALILLGLIVAAILVFRGVGSWLVREDPLMHADALTVLSGGLPYRAEAAAHYFESGYASEVWLTRPEGPSDQMRELGVQYVSEEDYDRQILIHLQVPEKSVRILPNTVIDTEQEVEEISRELRKEGKISVIIVTSPEHTRRVRALWKKLAGEDLKAVVRAAREDPFDADHWWRDTRDALSVVREVLGLMNVWAGLPIRPHAH